MFRGQLDSDALRSAWEAARERAGSPDLSAREWAASASAHVAAYHAATRQRTGFSRPDDENANALG
jgi:hypothetical protein